MGRNSAGDRPLTAAESSALRQGLVPVLRDLAASGGLAPEIVDRSWVDDPDVLSGFVYQKGLGGPWGVRTHMSWSAADQLIDLADQVQDWAVEALWTAAKSTAWPECPDHRNSHPLASAVDDAGEPVWRCPRTGRTVCAIGALG